MEFTNAVVGTLVFLDPDTREVVTLGPIIEVPVVDEAGEPVGDPIDLTATFASLAGRS